jgi:hypothetical protein
MRRSQQISAVAVARQPVLMHAVDHLRRQVHQVLNLVVSGVLNDLVDAACCVEALLAGATRGVVVADQLQLHHFLGLGLGDAPGQFQPLQLPDAGLPPGGIGQLQQQLAGLLQADFIRGAAVGGCGVSRIEALVDPGAVRRRGLSGGQQQAGGQQRYCRGRSTA